MSRAILFYWSKGADMRVKLLNEIARCNAKKMPCYINTLAEKFGVSHVAVRKHVELMLEGGFVRELNPEGKPVYLELTKEGENVLAEFRKK